MMRKLTTFFFFLSLVAGLFCLPQFNEAADTGYSITILKYKLNEGAALSEDVPIDGTKAEQVTDTNGNQLESLPGISYEVVRVSPTEGTSEFQPVEGIDAFSTTITTNAQGIAHIGNLTAGTYRVSEQANDILRNVMEPVTFELPLPQRTGEALSNIYLYPKSSVQAVPTAPTSPDEPVPPRNLPGTSGEEENPVGTGTRAARRTTTAAANEANRRLPQTSGTLGTMRPLYFLLALVVVMGGIGGYFMQNKKHRF